MTIAILEAGVRESDLTVQFEVDRIVVQLRRQGLSEPITVVAGTLYAEIVPELSKVTWHAEKVLIKLRKKTEGEWYELWSKEKKTAATAVTKPAATAAKPAEATMETAEDAVHGKGGKKARASEGGEARASEPGDFCIPWPRMNHDGSH